MKTHLGKETIKAIMHSEIASEEVNSMLVKKGNQLHLLILWIVGFFAVGYSLFDLLEQHPLQAKISASLLPSVFISYWFFKKNWTVLSKCWNLTHVAMVVSLHSMLQPPESFILAFYFPICISTLIVFQGRDRILGYLLVFLTFCFFLFLLLEKPVLVQFGNVSRESLKTLWMLNLSGASIVTFLEIIFILQINNSIQNELMNRKAELRISNEKLAATVHAREKMISIISHDLRSPLILIDAGLGFIYNENISEEKKNKLATDIRKRTHNTINLIDNLLLWTRNQADQINCQPSKIAVSSVNDMIRNYSDMHVGDKLIHFEFSIPDEGHVIADQNMLDGMLRNLISNAVKFTPNGGKVSIQMIAGPKNWRFSVSDTGVGMKPEVIEKVLKGDTISTSGTEKEKGHGLGLQLVRDFLHRHESVLEIHSEIGAGTRFSFNLPKV